MNLWGIAAILWFVAAVLWAVAGNLPFAVMDVAIGLMYVTLSATVD